MKEEIAKQVQVYAYNNTQQILQFAQTEKVIYGSSRLGTNFNPIPLFASQNSTQPVLFMTHNIGLSTYELTNHLGNVLSVISDKPIPHLNGQTVDYWQAEVRQATDYSPFGVQLQTRNLSLTILGNAPYRYGFQNQEFDSETGLVNYKYRMHDPRIGRFFAVDPLASHYSFNSPYAFSENCVINSIELEGLEKINHMVYSKKEKAWVVKWVEIDNNLTENVNAYHKFNNKGQNYQTVVKPWVKRSGHTESVTYNGNIKSGSDYRDNMYMQFKSTAEAKMTESERNQAIAINNSLSQDVTHYDSWEGSDEGVVPFEQGIKIMGGTVSVILTGGTIALAGEITFLSGLSLASGIDDMSTQADGTSLITKSTGITPENLDKLKLGVSVASFSTGTRNLIKEFTKASSTSTPWTDAQVMDMLNIMNDEISATTGTADQLKPKK